ncbi:MAG: hypothetical protein CVU06_15740, partial [Bacteroidetes bacterium HGW-Bacteroidetes-22]
MNKVSCCPFLAVVVFLLLTVVACSPARKAIREPLKQQGAAFLYEQLQKNKPSFSTLSTRAALDISSSKTDMSLKVQIRMQKDSL